jgi:hypothetical protein
LLRFRFSAGLNPVERDLRSRLISGREMSKLAKVTCNDCYFRRAGLCALPTDTPCPTFRAHTLGTLGPPHPPRLVPKPLAAVVAGRAA